MRSLFAAAALLALAACQRQSPPPPEATETPAPAPVPAPVAPSADAIDADLLRTQAALDRIGFTPGVLDGHMGLSTRNALEAFQEANGFPVSGEVDEATRAGLAQAGGIEGTRTITIAPDFAAGPFAPVPRRPADQARMPALGYASLDEKLAERFHTTPEVLRRLNPGKALAAGARVVVPNVGDPQVDPAAPAGAPDWPATLANLGVGSLQPAVERVEVSKSKGVLRAYDANGTLVAAFTATMGSDHDPLPIGRWKILGIDRNPRFHYNPDLFWDARPGDKAATLPPGPNGPVGVVWIDLSKPHYGIHGTPAPETIGRAESHGCVRLTNWDAARLAQMVHPGTRVLFKE